MAPRLPMGSSVLPVAGLLTLIELGLTETSLAFGVKSVIVVVERLPSVYFATLTSAKKGGSWPPCHPTPSPPKQLQVRADA